MTRPMLIILYEQVFHVIERYYQSLKLTTDYWIARSHLVLEYVAETIAGNLSNPYLLKIILLSVGNRHTDVARGMNKGGRGFPPFGGSKKILGMHSENKKCPVPKLCL